MRAGPSVSGAGAALGFDRTAARYAAATAAPLAFLDGGDAADARTNPGNAGSVLCSDAAGADERTNPGSGDVDSWASGEDVSR